MFRGLDSANYPQWVRPLSHESWHGELLISLHISAFVNVKSNKIWSRNYQTLVKVQALDSNKPASRAKFPPKKGRREIFKSPDTEKRWRLRAQTLWLLEILPKKIKGFWLWADIKIIKWWWPGCPRGRRSHSAPGWCGCTVRHYKAPLWRWTPWKKGI